VKLQIPNLSLVALIGPSGAGKSTFARKHFKATEVLGSDYFRGLVSDDENSQSATPDAFDVLHFVAAKRLAAGRMAVVDATSVRPEDRKPLVQLARQHNCLAVAIVFNLSEKVCTARNASRSDRDFGAHVVRSQRLALRRGLRGLQREGFRYVYVLNTPDEVESVEIERTRLWNDRRDEHGPFDIIGDVHGCFDELVELLNTLGYRIERTEAAAPPRWINPRYTDATTSATGSWGFRVTPPPTRRAIFLGDLVDRGPNTPNVLRLVMSMVADGAALCVPGNHDVKLMRKLRGKDVRIAHGLAESLAQLAAEPPEFSQAVADFLDDLVSHYVLDDGELVVAHAGLKAELQGRASGPVREFCLFGETTGETDEFGLPVRCNWAAEYRGQALVIYGHTPVPQAEWLNRTINIDTGCVFGGRLSALRYPERDLVSVAARHVYSESRRPFPPAVEHPAGPPALTAQHAHDDVLDIADMLGKRIIGTRLHGNVIVSAERGAAALEVLARFAADPKWLIYLPPTMSPCATAESGELLEHPREAFAYFRNEGIPRVVCQEKHMGSRAVVIVCRDEATARRRFGVGDGCAGIVYTRTGRRFFDDASRETGLLARLRSALDVSGFWDEFATEWVCLDTELMPWSVKAQALLEDQYAAVGASATAALAEADQHFGAAANRGVDVAALRSRYGERAEAVGHYVRAYRPYCWPVETVADLKLAPFHVLATEGQVHVGRDHVWHMETLAKVCAGDAEMLRATPYRVVDVTDADSEAEAVAWWENLTSAGGEGMVVKPLDFLSRGRRGLVQPAVKCRGREYLRIIYGPEYTRPENLERLRARSLGGKRALALREFALGIEALERFARGEPLRRVHECVFGVLALESEPIDPRL
jgi:protein phosphatase